MTGMSMTWDGDDAGEVEDPTPADLEERIRQLDGSGRTIVMLEGEGGYLAVGGSAADGLVVYADLGDGDFWSARSPGTDSTETVVVVAGGQPGDYEARLVTTPEVAMTAATTFLASGTLSDAIGWEKS